MSDVRRQLLEAQLVDIDLRRSQLEAMLSTMPHVQPCCEHNCERGELEDELKTLWDFRTEVTRKLAC